MRPLCQEGPSAKKFFKKLKYRLCRRPLHRTLGTSFFQQNRKNIFADGFCPGPSAQDFFSKKIEKPSLPTASAQGSWHRIFKKK
jgi:hypothetical protein